MVEMSPDAAKISDVIEAGFSYGRDVIRKRKIGIKDHTKIPDFVTRFQVFTKNVGGKELS